MPHSSAFVGHQGMQPTMMQPGPCPPRQQLQAVHMQQTYANTDSLADHLVTHCHIAAAPGRAHMLGPASGGMRAAGPGLPVAVSTAAYPPPGLTVLHCSQPGLLQPRSSMVQPPMSSTPQGSVVICGALSPSALPAMAQLMPAARGVQGMMPAAGVSHGLAPPSACPYMQIPSPGPYLAGQAMQAPSGYMQYPGMPGCRVPQVSLLGRLLLASTTLDVTTGLRALRASSVHTYTVRCSTTHTCRKAAAVQQSKRADSRSELSCSRLSFFCRTRMHWRAACSSSRACLGQ